MLSWKKHRNGDLFDCVLQFDKKTQLFLDIEEDPEPEPQKPEQPQQPPDNPRAGFQQNTERLPTTFWNDK